MVDNPSNQTVVPLVVKIVTSYVRHQRFAPEELSRLITIVHQALRDLGKPTAPAEIHAHTPAVSVRRSVQRDYVVCLECGFRGQALRGHLRRAHGLTPQQYRAHWNLPREHPIVAPVYSERRSAMAKQIGLGQGRRRR